MNTLQIIVCFLIDDVTSKVSRMNNSEQPILMNGSHYKLLNANGLASGLGYIPPRERPRSEFRAEHCCL